MNLLEIRTVFTFVLMLYFYANAFEKSSANPLPCLDKIPEEFRATVRKVHHAASLPVYSQEDLESDIQEIVPAEFYWRANGLDSYDLKDGMYVGLLKNNTSIFIKLASLESAIGEILTTRLFDSFDETKSIVPPIKIFQINSPFQLVNIFYQENNTIAYRLTQATGEYFIGTPFIKGSKLFVEFLGNPSEEEAQQLFCLEEKLRLTNLLQASLGIRDNHMGNYLLTAHEFFKIDGESAVENESFEVVRNYAFKALALPEGGEQYLREKGSAWESLVVEKFTFPPNFIECLRLLKEPHKWEMLLDFSLWDNKKASEHYDIKKAINRTSKLLDEIHVCTQIGANLL